MDEVYDKLIDTKAWIFAVESYTKKNQTLLDSNGKVYQIYDSTCFVFANESDDTFTVEIRHIKQVYDGPDIYHREREKAQRKRPGDVDIQIDGEPALREDKR